VLCVCGHLLIATRRSTSSCYASPRVLRIGLGGAENRRGLARCTEFWLLFIFRAILYCISVFLCVTLFPVFSFLLLSLPLPPPHHPHSPGLADIYFTARPYSVLLFSASRAPSVLRRRSTRAQYRRTAQHMLPGASEDRRCATSGVNEGAERAHPCDWPARRSYEVRELEHGYRRDVEVHPRSRSASSTRTRLPSLDSTRARLPTTGF
jgi:hypothetical protein